MPLPNSADLLTMDFAFQGQPFVIVASSGINLETMDFAFQGQPFVGNGMETVAINSGFFAMF